jgi:hypothetical protein
MFKCILAYLYVKKEREAYGSSMHSVCPFSPLITSEQTTDFHEIRYGGHTIEVHLDVIISNPVALTIIKWQTFRFLRLMQNLHLSGGGGPWRI